jgi:hypothetical protein
MTNLSRQFYDAMYTVSPQLLVSVCFFLFTLVGSMVFWNRIGRSDSDIIVLLRIIPRSISVGSKWLYHRLTETESR